MKILIQWAQRDPKDWIEITDWASLPKRPIPNSVGGEDNKPGYICGINVDGIGHSFYDHYAFKNNTLVMWNDDIEDYKRKMAREIYPDHQVFYFEGEKYEALKDVPFTNISVLPWEQFKIPKENVVHGIWLTNEKYAEHKKKRSLPSWRDWDEPPLDESNIIYYQKYYGRTK